MNVIKFWWRSGFSCLGKGANNTIIVVACPDRDAGYDPEAIGLAFHQGPTSNGGNALSWSRRSAIHECFVCFFASC